MEELAKEKGEEQMTESSLPTSSNWMLWNMEWSARTAARRKRPFAALGECTQEEENKNEALAKERDELRKKKK